MAHGEDIGAVPRSPDSYRRGVLRRRAQALADASQASELLEYEGKQLVCCRVGESTYGLPLRQMREIRVVERIAVIPCTPKFVVGLVQVHGDITVVIDLVDFFGFRRAEALPRPTTVLVIDVGTATLGIACDELYDVRPIQDDDVVPVPATVRPVEREVTHGLYKHILMLDPRALVNHPRLRAGR